MLVTLNQLKDALGISQGDSSKDPLLNSSILQANGLIAGYIGVDLSDVNTDRVFTTTLDNDWGHVQLPLFPVRSVTSISANGVAVPLPAQTDAMYVDQRLGTIENLTGAERGGGHGRYGSRVTVVYKTGYSPIPDDLQAVCLNIAASIYNNGGVIDAGTTAGSGELKSLTMFDAMSMSFDVGSSSGSSSTSSGPQAMLDAWAFVLKGYRCKTPVLA